MENEIQVRNYFLDKDHYCAVKISRFLIKKKKFETELTKIFEFTYKNDCNNEFLRPYITQDV